MVFDKTKAMRNAERFISQGKLQAAIDEYKQVVSNDPKDFGTLNMLGDLYTKNLAKKEAVDCYTLVAEHYSKQGFAQKAIALYNKISKLQPKSTDISLKLGDLYKLKGSVNEARTHYSAVAEYYESAGRKVDALEVRKQIASLDPNDTAIYLSLAEAYLVEDQMAAAGDAFAEAGFRFAKKSMHGEAVSAMERALEFKPLAPKLLAAFAESHFALGTAAKAAERVAEIHAAETNDLEVMQVLVDCYLEAGLTADAEKAVLNLVEKEPASYPRLLDLARVYLKDGDADSASRITAISSEHLLVDGQADEFQSLVSEILELDPEHLEGLKLRARLSVWQRDETGIYDSLAQLATVARERESIDDERFAIAQLVMIAPHEVKYVERLQEIKEQFGFDDAFETDNLFDEQFLKGPKQEEPELETFAGVAAEPPLGEESSNGSAGFADFEMVDIGVDLVDASPDVDAEETDEEKLLREIDSIKFYIDSGYYELAGKAIAELRDEFGERAEIDEIARYLEQPQEGEPEAVEITASSPEPSNGKVEDSRGFGIDDLRNELGIDEADAVDDSDYDTHFHTAVAYQEMGLLDEAVKEYQEAVGLVQPSDQSRRFFHCANLLGHCFMQKAMPNLALTWYQRALETPGLSDEEKQGIWYELATAYEAEGDMENAGRYFEQVYAENIDFRDVSQRVRNITVSR